MAQVKIYGLRSSLGRHREGLSEAIHQSLVESFGLPREKRFQRFFPLEPEDFHFPADRTDNYTILEVSIFEGRSPEAKKKLIRSLFSRISASTEIAPQDLEITIFETPKANWGIRGTPGDELALSYKVEV